MTRIELFTGNIEKIFSFLETIIQDGGKKNYRLQGSVKNFHFSTEGLSGFHYAEETFKGNLGVGILLGGAGFVLKRTSLDEEEVERFDYFNQEGDFTFSSDQEELKILYVDSLDMDLSCPILNHFYNYLHLEYKNASQGKSHTRKVHSIEKFLQKLYHSHALRLPIKDGVNDSAVTNIFHKILQVETDPVLTWNERQLIYARYYDEMDEILSTKIRVHKISKSALKVSLLRKKVSHFFLRLIKRPSDNLKGVLYQYTVGKVIWFFETVKNNLGYSIALAVYGPFTYYFITMPMNPHAMQAVGKVRSTYLEVKSQVSNFITGKSTPNALPSIETNKPPLTDKVTTIDPPLSLAGDVIYPAHSTMDQNAPLPVNLGDGENITIRPKILNMLVSTDVARVNQQSWFERMSNFKQMQIAYEENIEFASRMGRLEQLETQYNFPMQVESTWEELERYNALIYKLREENPTLTAKMKQYLSNEIYRTQQLEIYLWDRMARFILDQIYVMLDQDKEQKRNDYYVGRSFVFMQEMTNILSWRHKSFKKHDGFDRIEKLAEFYKASRKEYGLVMKNLEANSDLFKQKNVFDTREFRSYMKRQWEILYLQNAKAEEASNNGLNMYIWSVRNTIWVLQSIYSAKKEELPILVKRDVTGKLLTPNEMLSRSKISMMYETLFHNLNLEYVGIREEIMNRLGKDIESMQRMTIIENLKEFISDREKLDSQGLAKTDKPNGTQL